MINKEIPLLPTNFPPTYSAFLFTGNELPCLFLETNFSTSLLDPISLSLPEEFYSSYSLSRIISFLVYSTIPINIQQLFFFFLSLILKTKQKNSPLTSHPPHFSALLFIDSCLIFSWCFYFLSSYSSLNLLHIQLSFPLLFILMKVINSFTITKYDSQLSILTLFSNIWHN